MNFFAIASVFVSIVAAKAVDCDDSCCDLIAPPGGVELTKPCGRQHIDIPAALENGFKVKPYKDGIWDDCPARHCRCGSSSSSSSSTCCDCECPEECPSSSSSSSSCPCDCEESSSSSSCGSSESSESSSCGSSESSSCSSSWSSCEEPISSECPCPPKPTTTCTKMPPMVCTTVVLCYPGTPNAECDADQAELASQISSLISANMARHGATATVANSFAYVTSGAKVLKQGNDAPAGNFVGALTSVGAFIIAAAMFFA